MLNLGRIREATFTPPMLTAANINHAATPPKKETHYYLPTQIAVDGLAGPVLFNGQGRPDYPSYGNDCPSLRKDGWVTNGGDPTVINFVVNENLKIMTQAVMMIASSGGRIETIQTPFTSGSVLHNSGDQRAHVYPGANTSGKWTQKALEDILNEHRKFFENDLNLINLITSDSLTEQDKKFEATLRFVKFGQIPLQWYSERSDRGKALKGYISEIVSVQQQIIKHYNQFDGNPDLTPFITRNLGLFNNIKEKLKNICKILDEATIDVFVYKPEMYTSHHCKLALGANATVSAHPQFNIMTGYVEYYWRKLIVDYFQNGNNSTPDQMISYLTMGYLHSLINVKNAYNYAVEYLACAESQCEKFSDASNAVKNELIGLNSQLPDNDTLKDIFTKLLDLHLLGIEISTSEIPSTPKKTDPEKLNLPIENPIEDKVLKDLGIMDSLKLPLTSIRNWTSSVGVNRICKTFTEFSNELSRIVPRTNKPKRDNPANEGFYLKTIFKMASDLDQTRVAKAFEEHAPKIVAAIAYREESLKHDLIESLNTLLDHTRFEYLNGSNVSVDLCKTLNAIGFHYVNSNFFGTIPILYSKVVSKIIERFLGPDCQEPIIQSLRRENKTASEAFEYKNFDNTEITFADHELTLQYNDLNHMVQLMLSDYELELVELKPTIDQIEAKINALVTLASGQNNKQDEINAIRIQDRFRIMRALEKLNAYQSNSYYKADWDTNKGQELNNILKNYEDWITDILYEQPTKFSKISIKLFNALSNASSTDKAFSSNQYFFLTLIGVAGNQEILKQTLKTELVHFEPLTDLLNNLKYQKKNNHDFDTERDLIKNCSDNVIAKMIEGFKVELRKQTPQDLIKNHGFSITPQCIEEFLKKMTALMPSQIFVLPAPESYLLMTNGEVVSVRQITAKVDEDGNTIIGGDQPLTPIFTDFLEKTLPQIANNSTTINGSRLPNLLENDATEMTLVKIKC